MDGCSNNDSRLKNVRNEMEEIYDLTQSDIIYNSNEEYRKKMREFFYMDCSQIEKSLSMENIDEVSLDELLYDEQKIITEMEKLFEMTKDEPLFQNLYDLAAGKMFSIDRTIGQCVLFSYDYWHLFHKCMYVYFHFPEKFDETHSCYLQILEKIK